MKRAKKLNLVRVELTWTPRVSDIPADNFDLDACAFLLDGDDKLVRDEYFVFYNNLRSPEDAVVLKADDIDGADGEVMLVNLEKVPPQVSRILFVVTIYNAEERMQSFDDVSDAAISLYDRRDGKLIVSCPLAKVQKGATALQFGEFRREEGGEWEFYPLAVGEHQSLAHYVNLYSRS